MIRKNNYILLAFIGLFCLESLQAQWIKEKSSSLNNLNSIDLINEYLGWIVGDKGTMLYKVGSHWVNYQKITDENLYSVFLLDKNDGWAVGSKGIILHFNGKKWENFASPTSQELYSVCFKDPENGVAVGEHGTVVIYENKSWRLVKKTTRGNLYTVSAKADLLMIGGGLECVNIPIMKIADDTNKTLVNLYDPIIEIKSIAVTEQKNAWAASSPGEIFHFDGSEWKKLEFEYKLPTLNCIYFSDANNGISVGYNGTILTYSGRTWTKQDSPVDVKLNGAAIAGKTSYAVGNGGTIISWNQVHDDAFASAGKNSAAIKIEAYPNPSADILNIIIPVEDGFVAEKISITNVYGQVVLNDYMDPDTGGQVYQINTSALYNGLYLVNITSPGKKEASGKFMVKH
jgi:photosystem II stability/assembly factor-like uncharacterized protein